MRAASKVEPDGRQEPEGRVKSAITYTGANLVTQVVVFGSGLLLRLILAPATIGVWNFVQLVKSYVYPVDSGVLFSAQRELPMLVGAQDEDGERRTRAVAQTVSILEALVIAGAIWAYAAWTWKVTPVWTSIAYLFAGFAILPSRFVDAQMIFILSHQRYQRLSRALLAASVTYYLLLPVGAIAAGLPGLFLAAGVGEVVRGAILWIAARRMGLQSGWSVQWDRMKRLVKYGIGYRVADYPMTAFMNLDAVFITSFGGIESLAVYAFGKSIQAQASNVLTRVATVFQTRAFHDMGSEREPTVIAAEHARFLRIQLLVLAPPIIIATTFGAMLALGLILPAYTEAGEIIGLLMLSSFFMTQNTLIPVRWVAEGKLLRYLALNSTGLVLMTLALYTVVFIYGTAPLLPIAVAFVLAFAVYFTITMAAAGTPLFGASRSLLLWAEVMGAAALTAASVAFAIRYHGGFGRAIINGLVMLALVTPVVIYGAARTDTWPLVRRLLRKAG